jgi:hypothetical protein
MTTVRDPTSKDPAYFDQINDLGPEHIDGRSFVDSAYRTDRYCQFSKIELVSTAEPSSVPRDVDDASAEYSDISIPDSKIYTDMECLADDLFSFALTLQSDSQRGRTLCKGLPYLL